MKDLYLLALGCLLGVSACTSAQPRALSASAGCQKLGDSSQEVSRLFTSGDVYAAQEAQERIAVGRSGVGTHAVGADLYVHATEGQSSEYLQRVLVCHANAGRAVHPNDPFHPQSGHVAEVSVQPAGASYAVRIVGATPGVSEEILRRARALTSGHVRVEQVAATSSKPSPASAL